MKPGDQPGGQPGWAGEFTGLVLAARRELAVRMRSTAFRVSTLILLAAAVAGIAIPAALLGRPQRFTVAVAAQAPPTAAAVRAEGRAARLQVTVRPVADRAAAVRAVERGQATAAIAAGGEIIWHDRPSPVLSPVLNAAVQRAVIIQRAASLGLPPSTATRLMAPVRVPVTQLHAPSRGTIRTIVGYVGVILMFMAISVYGGYLLTGVVEEKSSRVVEVVLSRVSPSALLGGKITGIGLVGLAQFAAVVGTAAVTLAVVRPSGLPPGTYTAIPALVLWFVLGFAFYSMLYGSLGSLASRAEDAQAAAGPVIVLLVVIYGLAVFAMASPGAAWVTVLSLLPPSAPVIMPLRTALVNVPPWQVALALALMLAGIYGLFRAGSRLYRSAVLHTGPRLSLREAWRGEPAQHEPRGADRGGP